MENGHRRSQDSQADNRRIAQLPPVGAWHRPEVRPHLEPRLFVMAPPSGKARQIPLPAMPFMNKTTRDTSRTAIQIFVAAPYREVRAPLMKLQMQIAGSMCQIKADHAAPRMALARDAFHVKCLPRPVIHRSEHDQRDFIAVALNQ